MKTSRETKGPLSEINIVPLVDIMLVLLIIFMITAPMMQQGLGIDIPHVTAKPLESKEEPQILNITYDEQIQLNDKKLDVKDLKKAVEFLFVNKSKKELFIKADKNVPYGFVVKCMGLVREAGVNKVNIVTKPKENNE